MQLYTNIKLSPALSQVDYNSKILLLGSCFSENISSKFTFFNFEHFNNPFGILFQPIAIEQFINNIVHNKYSEDSVFYFNELWHSFEAHSKMSQPTHEALSLKLQTQTNKAHNFLLNATHVIITFGTSWAYKHLDSNKFVANCHKVPKNNFIKQLLSVETIVQSIDRLVYQIQSLNPKTQIIFTVSPVRHLKDGFTENTLSKAHLITAIHHFLALHQNNQSNSNTINVSYFPSYEIMMDELRDYRFYHQDMLHPNQTAIDYIWEKFKSVWICPKSFDIMEQVASVQNRLAHIPFNSASEAHQQFLKTLIKDIKTLKTAYPHFYFPKPSV